MAITQPLITTVDNRRQFACSPAAVLAFIVNPQEQVLLLKAARRSHAWEVVSGALDAGETVLAGVLREAREEIGPQALLRPLGAVHVSTVYYDPNAPYLLSLCYLLAYEGGEIVPGDDMRGAEWRWFGLDELAGLTIAVPQQLWLFQRAVELHRLWKDQRVDLQPVVLEQARRHENK